MKPLLPLLLLALGATLSFADKEDPYRLFHDLQGRSIRATIVRTAPDSVWIRREDGQTFRLDPATLSEKDRKFIVEWDRENQLQRENAIRFSVSRFSDGREREKTNRATRAVKNYGYLVTLENQTTIDLNDLSIEYRIFVWRGDIGKRGQNRDLERHSGFATIPELPSRSRSSFKTDTIELTSITLRPGSVFGSRDHPNSNQRRIQDDLHGVWVRVMEKGELIAEFASPSTLLRNESWEPEDAWWLQTRDRTNR